MLRQTLPIHSQAWPSCLACRESKPEMQTHDNGNACLTQILAAFSVSPASATFTSEDVQNSSGTSSSNSSEQEGQSSSKAGSSNRNVNIRAPEQSGWLTGRPVQNVETPQVVIDRIFSRMVRFSVAPVSLGIALLGVFYYLKVRGSNAKAVHAITAVGGNAGIIKGA